MFYMLMHMLMQTVSESRACSPPLYSAAASKCTVALRLDLEKMPSLWKICGQGSHERHRKIAADTVRR